MRLTGSGMKSCVGRTLGKRSGALRMKSCRSIRPPKILENGLEEILETVVHPSRARGCEQAPGSSRKRRGGGGGG